MNIMPRRDGTGPMGKGLLTGRGLGTCESSEEKQSATNCQGLGTGISRGRNCKPGHHGCSRGFGRNEDSQQDNNLR